MKTNLRALWRSVAAMSVLATAVLAAVVAFAEPERAAPRAELPPIPPDIAARLPKYCRYELDLGDTPDPHRAILSASNFSTTTCPFATGAPEPVVVLESARPEGCIKARFPAFKVRAVEQLDGRAFRRAAHCTPPPTHGRAFLLTIRNSKGLSMTDMARFGGFRTQQAAGLPFAVMTTATAEMQGPGDYKGAFYACVELLPSAHGDPLDYFREVGGPLPEGVSEQEVTGKDCRQLTQELPHAGGLSGFNDASAPAAEVLGEFTIWIVASPQSPTGFAFARSMRNALTAQGAQPARARTGQIWVVGHQLVARLPGGSHVAVMGASGLTTVSFRSALTPETCSLVFAMADASRSYLQIGSSGDFRPPSVRAETVGHWKGVGPVHDAGDLCALAKPAFDEWVADAPRLPKDLRDLDRQEGWISIGYVDEP